MFLRQSEKPGEAIRQARRKTLGRRLFEGTCIGYTILSLLYFLIYLWIFLADEQNGGGISYILHGGITVRGHALILLVPFAVSLLYAFLFYKKPRKTRNAVSRYLIRSSFWYALFEAILILVYGFYLDTLYDPYAVTEAAILMGPSFLLSAASLGTALVLPLVNRILTSRIPLLFRLLLHFAAVLAVLGVFFLGLADGFSSAAAFLIFSAVFAVCYALSALLAYLLRGAQKKDENDASEYESMFAADQKERPQGPSDHSDKK